MICWLLPYLRPENTKHETDKNDSKYFKYILFLFLPKNYFLLYSDQIHFCKHLNLSFPLELAAGCFSFGKEGKFFD